MQQLIFILYPVQSRGHGFRKEFLVPLQNLFCLWASLVAETIKNLPAMQETGLQSLGQEDPLNKEMTTNSIIVAWRIPWTEGPGVLQSIEWQRVGLTEQLTLSLSSAFRIHHFIWIDKLFF